VTKNYEQETFNPETLGEDIKLVHHILKKRGITDWFVEYEDLVQDILLMTLEKVQYYDPSRGSKNTFIGIMTNQVLSLRSIKTIRGVSGTGQEEVSTEDINIWDIPLSSDNIENNVYVEEVFNSLTLIQQMEAMGYTFKEIEKETGEKARSMNAKKGLASRNRKEKRSEC
jgi:DNA-directed RNA polymerase specialized sigma24 family protein